MNEQQWIISFGNFFMFRDLKKVHIIILRNLLTAFLMLGISSDAKTKTICCEEEPDNSLLTVTVNLESTKQIIRGFGASDAWSIQFVGANWPVEKRERIADLLFSTSTTDDGNPEGIGLSIWRFNIGGGSAQQGEGSGISDEWRRAEGFLQDDLTYDWSKQKGQKWFLKAAADRGVQTFIGFSNSPPIQLTRNGLAYGDGGFSSNLPESNYKKYAEFLGDIVSKFDQDGIQFHTISPMNEPQWNWSEQNNQEGSAWRNDEIANLAKVINDHFEERNISTKIDIPEAAQINFLYSDGPDGRGNQLDYFWNDSETELSHLERMANVVSAHGYFTTWPISEMIRHRTLLREKLDSMDNAPELWMTEYCILENNEEVQGRGRDIGMDPALYMARLMHYELSIAEASSWQWWLAVSPYDYNDGLIYIDRDTQNGDIYVSKTLWAMGNYSRFILPDAVRVETVQDDELSEEERANQVMTSAYRNPDGSIVLVAINYSDEEREMKLNFGESNLSSARGKIYVTSNNTDLENVVTVKMDEPVVLTSRSVSTIVIE